MEKNYDPKLFEDRIYDAWMDAKAFNAYVNPEKKPFTIVLPPPNITGQLHMGHALDQTIQDILIRFKRMQGFEALWLPGTDHASIATEVKVLENMEKTEGLTKDEISREDFLERAWKWRDDYGRRIVNQMKKLGSSCDWDRERFTMDDGCNAAVTEVFIRLYEQGHIYRGQRLINWCPDCRTTLSDAEVEHEEKSGHFYHVKYPLADGEGYIEIATTRPETMLGDTAIAVHPDDERYKHLVGKKAILPLVGRKLPIVGDPYVDSEKGTGALKVTPAHDPNDFEIGERHDLESLSVLDNRGRVIASIETYGGMDRYEARKTIVKDLEAEGYLLKTVDHDHNVGTCYRCHTVVEPMISEQWFVAMEKLAEPAIDALKSGDLTFVPERFEKIYLHWLENIRDWCISRQLWWGHRIPAYHCEDCKHVEVSKTPVTRCSVCGSTHVEQDPDVLDTWFSSALWPFSTLGWPEKTPELEYFYPTDVLVTGYDIIFFWVVRMVFSGIEQMGEVPFSHTLIHGLVRDAQGRKMSKSLGNGVDPLDIIDEYGADALRFMLATGNAPGADVKFQIERVEASRNFANKLWNASRFVLMNVEEGDDATFDGTETFELADRWILSRLSRVAGEVTENLEKFELGLAADKIYEFVWNEYCDWYIELTKKRLYGDDPVAKKTAKKVLLKVLGDILRLLHPFIPFITEEIYRFLPNATDQLVRAQWPEAGLHIDREAEEEMATAMAAVRSLRNARANMDVPPSRKAKLYVRAEKLEIARILSDQQDYLMALASVSEVSVLKQEEETPDDCMSAIIEGAKLFVPLSDLIDFQKEHERLKNEEKKLVAEVERLEKKLSNANFVEKAPEKIVAEEREKKEKYDTMLASLRDRITSIEGKLNG
jgi:valyl-tRNA synthetase